MMSQLLQRHKEQGLQLTDMKGVPLSINLLQSHL